MVIRGSAVTPNPVVQSLIALFLVVSVPACSDPLGSDRTTPTVSGVARHASSLALGGSGAGNFLAGRFALDQHDLGAASDFLLKALATDPENIELLQRSLVALAADGRLTEAAAVSRRLLTYDGDAALAAMLVAEQEAKDGHWAKVEEQVAHLPRRGLNAFMVPVISAWARAAQGNTDGALAALAPLSQTSSFAALHDFHAALIADLADRRQLADQYYHSILSGDSGQTLRTVQAATAFYRRIGQPDTANRIQARYRQAHPDLLVADAGALSARPIDSARDGLAEAFFGAAGTWRQGNLPELALVFDHMAVDLQPDFSLARLSIGDILQGLGRLQEANEAFARIDTQSPVYWAAQLRMAANMDDLGDVDGAVNTLRALSDRHPDRPDGLITLGDVLRRHERWADAAAVYDRALAVTPPNEDGLWALYYSRGIALERSKQWPRAEGDFLKALELRPDEPHVLNYLGYSWIEQGINVDRARAMIEKAVEQRPTDGYIVDSLGWAYYRMGSYAKAVDTLERAVELRPEDATINDHLGDALWGVGRREEARFQWQRALTFQPEADLKAQIERKLAGDGPTPPVSNASAK